jgi:hypothetical protein
MAGLVHRLVRASPAHPLWFVGSTTRKQTSCFIELTPGQLNEFVPTTQMLLSPEPQPDSAQQAYLGRSELHHYCMELNKPGAYRGRIWALGSRVL